MIGPLLIVAVCSLPVAWVALRRPVQRRLALRYPMRRLVESVLVVLGTLLGTAIITGSLVVGDTIDRSIRASAYEQLGPIDELVTVSGVDEGLAVLGRLDGLDAPSLDGRLVFVTVPVAVVGSATQPRAQIVEVDFSDAAAFGDDPSIVGIAGPQPALGHAIVTDDLARRAGATAGDVLTVYVADLEVELTVDRVVPRRGVAGFWEIDGRQQSYNIVVPPGTLADIAADLDPDVDVAEPPSFHIAFSNVGGVESGADRTDEAMAALAARLEGSGAQARPVKRNLLEIATEAASSLTQLYFTMGMFAVAAGVLLVVNIFVMLADERRSELGMLRAIGMRRRPLVGAFAIEGWVYSISAGIVGALLGIGFGWLIAWRADAILSDGGELNSLHLTFAFDWSTIATGFAVGFVISMATIVATSARTSRMNIISAIRDLPASAGGAARRRWVGIGLAASAIGTVWTAVSLAGPEPYGIALGPMLAIVGLVPAAGTRVGTQPATAVASIGVLVWGTVFVGVLGVLDVDVEIPMFLVQGLTMAGAAVALVTAYQGVIGRWIARRVHGALPVRLGLAYPIARRSRTAMTLAMFAVVILTLVYLSVLSFIFENQVDEMADDLSGGFGVVVTSNTANPVTTEQLVSLDGVGAVAPLTYGFGEFTVGDGDPRLWPLTGFGAELVAAPPSLQERDPAYPDDAAVWAAVLDDPDLVIIDEFFLAVGGGPPSGVPRPGTRITIGDPVSGTSREVTIAAWAENDWIFNGVFYGRAGVDELTGGRAVASRFFVEPFDDADALVTAIRRTLVANGADAETVTAAVETALAQQNGFFTLMQQFVGVGLIVGICGIGVLMVRAVRERRRVVGVLRAIGFPARSVGRAFLIEAIFVSLEGVVIGVAVALIGSYGLVASGADFTEGMTWGVPWPEVTGIAALALGASALTALIPARRASRIEPAEALRIAD